MSWQFWVGLGLLGALVVGALGTFTYMAWSDGGWRAVTVLWTPLVGLLLALGLMIWGAS